MENVELDEATAAGAQHYDVVDVPLEQAYAVLAQVSPGLVAEFG